MIPSPPETRASLILRLPDAADVAAWDEFVAIYGPVVFRMAQRQGMQPADTDDLVQEVFTTIARSVGQWLDRTDRGSFRAWLLRIARNLAVNLLTRRARGTMGTGGDDATHLMAQIPSADGTMSGEFDLEYRREVFHWAAEQVRQNVSEITWQAFWMTHVNDLSIAEAAAQLRISVGNVYISRSRVMARLRESVQKFEVAE